jgi:hypothetical protein
LARKRPCDPILERDALPEKQRDNPHRCRFCGRVYSRADNLARHLKVCKIANSDEGMEKLLDHTLQRQLAEQKKATEEMKAQNARMETQMAEMMQILRGQAAPPAQQVEGTGAAIVNGPVTVTQNTQVNIAKIEIHPWDTRRAVLVDAANIAAAFAENPLLREYARLSDFAMTDPDIAPPYVTEFLVDMVKRGHADPASRNIYLNPRRADQVLVHLKGGAWEVKTATEGYRALLDGVAMSIHETTLSHEKRKLLPLEAQNALAMAGLLYDEEPEEYVKRAKAALTAHLTNLAPPASALVKQ